MNEKIEENEIQNQSEQVGEPVHKEVEEEIQRDLIENEPEQIEIDKKEQLEATFEELQITDPIKKQNSDIKTKIFPIPSTRIGFFLRGLLIIALGAHSFMHQDDGLQIFGSLFGYNIVTMPLINIMQGYLERLREFYRKWLIIVGILGLIFGVIAICVPLLVFPFFLLFIFPFVLLLISPLVFIFLTKPGISIIQGNIERFKELYGNCLIIAGVLGFILGFIAICVPLLIFPFFFLLFSPFLFLSLTILLFSLGLGDIVLAINIRKISEIKGTLILLGLVSIAASIFIYTSQYNIFLFLSIYLIASGLLSIAICLFMKKTRKE